MPVRIEPRQLPGSVRSCSLREVLVQRISFERLCRARDQLCDAGEVPASVRTIARSAGISPFHFIRQFDALFGATPHQYRTRVRLARACDLLAQGRSVTEVCMEVGFSSLGSFSSAFARRVGESPSRYQRRVRTMVQVPGVFAPSHAPGCLSLMAWLPPSAFAISEKHARSLAC